MDGNNVESFNMAIATLARLDGILRRMEYVAEVMNGLSEQKLQIKLLRHFFSNATPLINIVDKKLFEGYKKRVLGIKIKTITRKGKTQEYYSPDLDNEIMGLVMEIQTEIKGYFMPPSKSRLF